MIYQDKFNLAKKYSLDKLYDQSIPLWEELKKEYPHKWEVWLDLAIDQRRMGNRLIALDLLKVASDKFSDRFWVLYHLALLALESQQFDIAEQCAYKIIHFFEENSVKAYALLGEIAIKKLRYKESIFWFDKILNIEPAHEKIIKYKNIAEKYIQIEEKLAYSIEVNQKCTKPDYPVFIVNLDARKDKFHKIKSYFEGSLFDLKRTPGIPGAYLPDIAVRKLKTVSQEFRKGDLGCILSHIATFESIVKNDIKHALVLEDDAKPLLQLPKSLKSYGLPPDYDVCFVNARMEPLIKKNPQDMSSFKFYDTIFSISTQPNEFNAPGCDAYFISQTGARKLLSLFERDGFSTNMDWRIVSYTSSKKSIESLNRDSTTWHVLKPNKSDIAALNGYVMSPALFECDVGDSDRLNHNV